ELVESASEDPDLAGRTGMDITRVRVRIIGRSKRLAILRTCRGGLGCRRDIVEPRKAASARKRRALHRLLALAQVSDQCPQSAAVVPRMNRRSRILPCLPTRGRPTRGKLR